MKFVAWLQEGKIKFFNWHGKNIANFVSHKIKRQDLLSSHEKKVKSDKRSQGKKIMKYFSQLEEETL